MLGADSGNQLSILLHNRRRAQKKRSVNKRERAKVHSARTRGVCFINWREIERVGGGNWKWCLLWTTLAQLPPGAAFLIDHRTQFTLGIAAAYCEWRGKYLAHSPALNPSCLHSTRSPECPSSRPAGENIAQRPSSARTSRGSSGTKSPRRSRRGIVCTKYPRLLKHNQKG